MIARSRRLLAAAAIICTIFSAQPAQPATAYVGNTNSKVFHLLSCRYAGCKHCTRYFSSRDEAIDAGFRPGGCCHP